MQAPQDNFTSPKTKSDDLEAIEVNANLKPLHFTDRFPVSTETAEERESIGRELSRPQVKLLL
jgi:hypothetical protein